MLSRTADNLYWLSRYAERADFVARILDAALRLSALPANYGGSDANEWESALASAGNIELFRPLYDSVNEHTVRDFLAFSPNNRPRSGPACRPPARTPAACARR